MAKLANSVSRVGHHPRAPFQLARETCCLPALAYHYDRLALHSFRKIAFSSGSIRLKTYCYVLRPVLTLLWLRRRCEAPPMDLPGLLNGIVVTENVRQAIAELVERKAAADEQGTCARLPVLDALIVETLSQSVNRFVLADRTAVCSQANALFASIVRSASSPDTTPRDSK